MVAEIIRELNMGTNFYFYNKNEPRLHIGKRRDGDRPFHSTMSPRVIGLLYGTGKYIIIDEYSKKLKGESYEVYSLMGFFAANGGAESFVDGEERHYSPTDDYW